jgi:hypothetical protein
MVPRQAIVRAGEQHRGVPPESPSVVVWSDHALVKADLLGISRTDVEEAVLHSHSQRTRNTGAADWLVTVRQLAVAYNHPDAGDQTTARVVTLWRRG